MAYLLSNDESAGTERQLRLALTVENILPTLSAGNLEASTRRPSASHSESKYLICTVLGVDQASAGGTDDGVLSHESAGRWEGWLTCFVRGDSN